MGLKDVAGIEFAPAARKTIEAAQIEVSRHACINVMYVRLN